MKNIFVLTSLLMSLFVFSNCQNKSQSSEGLFDVKSQDNLPNKIIEDKSYTTSTSTDKDLNHVTDNISDTCSKLQSDYAALINKINNKKENKELISELIAWTKEPNHLNCLEKNQGYNTFIEKLNATL